MFNGTGTGYNAGISIANGFWDQVYGGGLDLGALTNGYIGAASGAVFGTNPRYTMADFLGVYAKFFGPATAFTGSTVAPARTSAAILQGQENINVASAAGITDGDIACGIGIPEGATVTAINGLVVTLSLPALTNGTVPATFINPATSSQITGIADTTGMVVGQLVSGPGLGGGSIIASIAPNVGATPGSITLSSLVCSSQTGAAFSFYPAPWVRLVVLQVYINLAQASIMQARYQEAWPLAMALYIAHYVTLWMETETGPNSTAAQVATSGLQQGIIVSQAAGDVSASTQPIEGLEDWGSLNLTQYGIQFASMAAAIGSGPVWVGSAVSRFRGFF